MIKVSVLFLSGLIFYSCASFKETYSCMGRLSFSNGDYKYCKSKKDNLWGVYTWKDNKEVLGSNYKSISRPSKNSDKIFLEPKDGSFIEEFNLKTGELKKTNFKFTFNPPIFLSKSGSYTVAFDEDQTLYTFNNDGSIKAKIPGFDKTTYSNRFGFNLNIIYQAWFGDTFFGRFRKDGRVYYQHFDTSGNLIGKEYPASNIEVVLVEGHYFIFEKLSEHLYFPILYNNETKRFLDKPNNLDGLVLNFKYEWHETKKFHDVKNQNFKIPTIRSFLFQYNDNGVTKYRYKSVYMNSLKKWSDFREDFSNINGYKRFGYNKPEDYTNLKWYKRKDVNKDGVALNLTTPYFQGKDGKWNFIGIHGFFNSRLETSFESEKSLIAYFDDRTKNTAKYGQEMISIREADRADLRRAHAELRAADNAAKEKLYAEKKARRDYDRKKVKEASAKAWGSVGAQIQGAGRNASKKAKCISKRTATKKAFLDKKQGWYETGGCK